VKKNKGFRIEEEKLICNPCEETIAYDLKHGSDRLNKHLNSAKHKRNTERNAGKPRQTLLASSLIAAEEKTKDINMFFYKIVKAFLESDIPLYKLNHPSLKSFLEEYMKRSLPEASTARKNYVQRIHEEIVLQIMSRISLNSVFFILDETTDECKRYVLNVLIGSLNGEYSKPMLLTTKFLEQTNHSAVPQASNDSVNLLWPEGVPYDKVWLVLTDQAPYMIKAFRGLKLLYPKLSHISCLIHALHLVCKEIRVKNSEVNELVSSMKKILLKSPYRILEYRRITGLALPPSPVIIRWGT